MKMLAIVILSYLIGSLSAAYFLGKIFRDIDIRGHGSGNLGTTNAIRVMGVELGVLTFIFDVFKGIVAVLLGRFILGYNGGLIAGVFAVIGHNWPIFLGFKGGKGVATSLGVLIVYSWLGTVLSIGLALIFFFRTRYVSLGSMIFLGTAPIITTLITKDFNKQFFITSLILGSMAMIRHKDNLQRLKDGTENKFGR